MKALRMFITGLAFLAIPFFCFPKPAAGSDINAALPGIVQGAATLIDVLAGNEAAEQDVLTLDVVGNIVSGSSIAGVPSDPGIWELEQGLTTLSSDGTLVAELLGLSVEGFVASNTEVAADVFCDGVLVHSTGFFLTDRFGDVLIRDFVDLPRSCFDPFVLFVNADEFWIAIADRF
jgi:hypothetical protein